MNQATLVTNHYPELVDLVDSLVSAIDLSRTAEVIRVRDALEAFGATRLFDDELRLNGATSVDEDLVCLCEVWL